MESSNYPFFLDVRTGEGAFYNPLGYHMKFKKRRAFSKKDAHLGNPDKPTKVLLKHRVLTEDEITIRQENMKELLQRDVNAEDV